MNATVNQKGRVRVLLDGLYLGTGLLAAACILGMFLLMMAQAVGREIGINVRGAVELTAWGNAATAFLGLAYAFKHGDIIRVGLALDRLKGKARWYAEILSLAIASVAASYAVWAAGSYVLQSYRMHDVTDGMLVMPTWIPQMSMLCGLVVFMVAVVDEFVLVAKGNTPTYEIAIKERTRRGEFGEES